MGIFTRKAGGSLVGNLFRVGLNKLTGGILGNGAMRLPVNSSSNSGAPTEATIQQTEAEKITLQALKSVQAVNVANAEAVHGSPENLAKKQRILNYVLLAFFPITIGLYLIFKNKK